LSRRSHSDCRGTNRIRILTIVDVYTREALCTRVGQRLRGEHVVDVCNRLVASRGAPVRVFVDNGDECLNVHWFETLGEATEKIEAWRVESNESRPHQGLKEMTPAQFAGICRTSELSEEQRNAGN
jgi:putative transposase